MQKKKFSLLFFSRNFSFCLFFVLNFSIQKASENPDCLTVLEFLTSPNIALNKVLSGPPLFNKIEKTNIRDILSTPTGLYYNQNSFFEEQIGINFFFIQVPGGIATSEDSNNLKNILNTGSIIDILKQSSNLFTGQKYSTINFPLLINFLDHVNINDLRFGSVIQGMYEINNNTFGYTQIPFTYNAYYISAPSETQSTISTEITQLQFDPHATKIPYPTGRDIIIKHTVADFFGIERSILGIHYDIYKKIISIEGRVLFPSLPLKRGIVGGNFSNLRDEKLKFSFKDYIFNILEPETKKTETNVGQILTNTINKIVSTVYGNSFGSTSWGISPSLFLNFPIYPSLFINIYATCIYNFLSKNKVYGYRNTKINFPVVNEQTTEEEACHILSLFDQEFANKITLDPISFNSNEGNQVQGSISIQSNNSKEKISLGLDMWHKFSSTSFKDRTQQSDFIYSVNQFPATQINLFVDLELFKQIKCSDIAIQFFLQSTLYAEGIGKEYGGKIQFTYFY